MSECQRAVGDRADRAVRGLEHCETVLDALVLDPNARSRNEWTIEVTVTGDRLPSEAVQVLVVRGGVDDASRAGRDRPSWLYSAAERFSSRTTDTGV